MAYSLSNPPTSMGIGPPVALHATTQSGSGQHWLYKSADALATVQAPGYFSNGQTLGMQQGDVVIVSVEGGATPNMYLCLVSTVSSSDQSVNLSSTNTPQIQ